MDALSLVIVIAVCLLLSAFFSGSETALLRLAPHDLEEEVKALRGPAALAARDLLDHTSRLLVTILLGNNLVNILAASAASVLAIHAFGEGTGILVSTVVMTMLVLVFCEVLPKAAAAAHPRRIGFAVALPIYVLHQLLRPVHAVFDRLVEPVVRRVGGQETRDSAAATEAVLRLARANSSGDAEGIPLCFGKPLGRCVSRGWVQVQVIVLDPSDAVAHRLPARFSEVGRFTRSPAPACWLLGATSVKPGDVCPA